MEDKKQQSLDRWRLDLKRLGRGHWGTFYEHFMGVPLSSKMRLGRALNLYGDWYVFDAIVDASSRELTGDPLNYVLKIASNKWKEDQLEQDEQDAYDKTLEQSKKASLQAIKDLEKRIARRKKK